MRLLLDECIDRRLSRELEPLFVKTAPQMGWSGIKNGKLLSLAQEEFDVFITVDRNLPFQQNIPKYDIAVLILSAKSNSLSELIKFAPKILEAVSTLSKGAVTTLTL